jgi:alanyl-tRNA synthetase
MRVVSDHLRAVAFAIADGELPSNNKAGYVIRRILRRAIRYGYTFLDFREPFVHKLVPVLVQNMGNAFPELTAQQDLISRVIAEEESTFLRTLSIGIHKFEQYLLAHPEKKVIDGQFAFELFDTYGFPIDLTLLMAREQAWEVDMEGFAAGMEAQKNRSRAAAVTETSDWVELKPTVAETRFLGYDHLEAEVELLKYRKVISKGRSYYQLVFDQTPFYAESGGQIGDRGVLESDGLKIQIVDTQKENNLVVHIAEKIPQPMPSRFLAKVDWEKRQLTANNHTATHLLHAALKEVLGNHVQQKGSLVNEERLRFDFSHFAKMTQEEIERVERRVNAKIRENITQEEHREMEMLEAQSMGAVALFGEKYGEKVRVIAFDKDFSAELCGGTHVHSTGQIGLFRIVSEGAIAAGIRRIEAITGLDAERYVNQKVKEYEAVKALLKNPKDAIQALEQLLEQNETLRKKLDALQKDQAGQLVEDMAAKMEAIGGVNFIGQKVEMDAKMAKDLAYAIKNKVSNLLLVLGHVSEGKPGLVVMISDNLVADRGFNAGNIIRSLATHIKGGGGGQPFFATAGGKDPQGLEKAIAEARKLLA